MPFQFKLSKRLAISHAVFAAGVLTLLACTPDRSIVGPAPTDAPGVPIESLLTQKNFGPGDRVKVIKGTLNVRTAATITGTLLGTQVVANLGTIIGGPVFDTTGDKLWRWKVDFDQGADGWAADYYLTLVSATPVASVAVEPASVSVLIGNTAQLAASVKDSLGNVLTGRVITWTSRNTPP